MKRKNSAFTPIALLLTTLLLPTLLLTTLLLTTLLASACSSGSPSRRERMRPCPTQDLTVPCGRTALGNLFRL